MEKDARWHHGQTLAAGQVVEFKVWSELVRQSMGGLQRWVSFFCVVGWNRAPAQPR